VRVIDVRELTGGQKYEAYERRFNGFLLVLTGLFLVIWSYDSLDASFSPRIDSVLVVARAAIWVVFGIDLIIRIVLAKSSWRSSSRRCGRSRSSPCSPRGRAWSPARAS
jgi:hypothetical protein